MLAIKTLTNNINKKTLFLLIGVILFLIINALELFLLTTSKNMFGTFFSPIAIFACGLYSGIFFLSFFRNKKVLIESEVSKPNRNNWILMFILFVLGVWNCGDEMRQIIRSLPIDDFYDPKSSDAIPQIGIMVDRFLNGEMPYRMIHKEWTLKHALYPTYLPMTWMPFIIPDILKFDYRWMSFGVLLLSFFYFLTRLIKWNFNKIGIIFLGILPYYILNKFQIGDLPGFQHTVETLITGFYLFLAFTIFSKSSWQMGLALLFCLLSRYSVVLWVPLFFLVLFFEGKRKDILKIGLVIFVGFMVLYLIPFFSKDTSIFIKGYNYHTHAAKELWNLIIDGKPYFFFRGHGFADFFYAYFPGGIEDKLHACQKAHLMASSGTVLILTFVYYKIRNTIDYRLFLLGSLKVYLVVFYNFIQIPFNYLFMVPFFISLPMIAILFKYLQTHLSNLKTEQLSS